MGMFDDIDYTAPCPICGTPLRNWQSKDAGCSLELLTPAQLWEQRYDDETATTPRSVDFYDGCGKCGTLVNINISSGLLDMTEHDFKCLRDGVPLQRRRGPVIPDAAASRAVGEEQP